MHRLQMRTILLIALMALSFGTTAISLLVIRVTVKEQIHANLEEDLQHSVKTYLNLERQRKEMLTREAALLADLPSLKSLMTTNDMRTIEDAGIEFWLVSGSDFMALSNPKNTLISHYARGSLLNRNLVGEVLKQFNKRPEEANAVAIGDRLYEVVAQPIYFGRQTEGMVLGHVAIGYSIDQRVAQEVREAAAADVAFTVDGQIVVSTIGASLQEGLRSQLDLLATETEHGKAPGRDIRLGQEQYLATAVPLEAGTGDVGQLHIQLVVLKSYNQASALLMRVNRWLLGIGALSLLVSGLLAVSISRSVTRPLEALVEGSRALGRGDFAHRLSDDGTAEVRELSRAFEGMRGELRRSQQELLDSERLATIGRMASSISHDLRHYLSAMYANAEFLSLANTPQADREELIRDVQAAVHGMTDLLDSLLVFSRTGNAMSPSYESIGQLIERSITLVRSHPEAHRVEIALDTHHGVDAWVDAKKLGRAVFNLALNACQAAKRGDRPPLVTVRLAHDEEAITIHIGDSGAGVATSIRETMFLPFVSSGKENGIGLGLTLSQHIAQEHGGSVSLDASCIEGTIFSIVLPKVALNRLRGSIEEQATRI